VPEPAGCGERIPRRSSILREAGVRLRRAYAIMAPATDYGHQPKESKG